MGLADSIKSGISRAIWKGVKHAGTALAGVLAAFAVKKFGYEISIEQQTAIAVAVTGALGSGLKILKDKFPSLSWL